MINAQWARVRALSLFVPLRERAYKRIIWPWRDGTIRQKNTIINKHSRGNQKTKKKPSSAYI